MMQKEKQNNDKKYMKIQKYDFSKAELYLDGGKISNHIICSPNRYNILLKEETIPQDAFWADKKHKNGPEIHVICKNATILIFNEKTKKLCTILFGRPGQIERYYKACKMAIPKEIMDNAQKKSNEWKKFNITKKGLLVRPFFALYFKFHINIFLLFFISNEEVGFFDTNQFANNI